MKRVLIFALFPLGFVLGVMTFCLVLRCGAPRETALLSLERETESLYSEAFPEETLYHLKYRGRDFGSVTLDDEGVKCVLLIDAATQLRQISIDRKDGLFPGKTHVEVNEGDLFEPVHIVFDNDMDGIPDGRMDWATKTVYVLDDIQWRVKDRPETQPATSEPASTQTAWPDMP